MLSPPSAPASVESLVPQRSTSLLLEAVLAVRPDGIECRCRIPEGHTLARHGRAPAFLGLEAAAQGAAAMQGLLRLASKGGADAGQADGEDVALGPGLLVSIRDAVFPGREIIVPEPFTISVSGKMTTPNFGLYRARVVQSGSVCAEGNLATFQRSGRPPQ